MSHSKCGLLLVILLGMGCQARSSGPTVVEAVAPVFPLEAVSSEINGTVTVDVELNSAGKVVAATVRRVESQSILRDASALAEKSKPALSKAALTAALRWRFGSGGQGRHATLTFRFRMLPGSAKLEDETARFIHPFEIEVASRTIESKDVY